MRVYGRKLYYLSSFCKNFSKNYCTNPKNVTEKLTNRSLLQLKGKDSALLLQGLVTNDVNHLSEIGIGCLYAMFLNTKGRVLYDTIIYKTPDNSFFVECDKSIAITVQKHLNMYRLRRDVTISNIDDKYELWVSFNPDILPKDPKQKIQLDENIGPCINPKGIDNATIKETNDGNILEFVDPRLMALGNRIIASKTCERSMQSFCGDGGNRYKIFRYQLGIGEGVNDLPPGNCFPLEANCDYLHGVSFHKGCYLGQELTARSHHTGIIRKRYMPVYFEKSFDSSPSTDEIVRVSDTNVGKLRGVENNVGLGLLRIEKVMDKSLEVSGVKGFTIRPFWWPSEKLKECKAAQM